MPRASAVVGVHDDEAADALLVDAVPCAMEHLLGERRDGEPGHDGDQGVRSFPGLHVLRDVPPCDDACELAFRVDDG